MPVAGRCTRVMWRCTCCGAMHLLRGAAPVAGRCTRCGALHPNRRGVMPTDRVYCCLCCGCCGGVWWRVALRCGPLLPLEFRAVVHPLWGAAPVVGRCTRCGALHPLCSTAPEQKGCSADGSGVLLLVLRLLWWCVVACCAPLWADVPVGVSCCGALVTSAAPVAGRCTRYVALHPNRRGVVLTDRVYCCLCCGCCGGVWWRVALRCGPLLPLEFRAVVHPLWGAAPVVGRCTCYVALHPNRRGVMPTDRV